MIYNIIVALTSAFSFVHNVNTIKEDYNSSYADCKVWGFEDGSWASQARWGAKLGLDSIGAVSSGLLFVDSVSGGNIRTKAIREFLGGFDSSSDLKDKCSKVEEEVLGTKPQPVKEQPKFMVLAPKNQKITSDDIECCTKKEDFSFAKKQTSKSPKNYILDQMSENANNESECSSEDSSADSSLGEPLDNSLDNSSGDSSDIPSDNSSDDSSENSCDSLDSSSGNSSDDSSVINSYESENEIPAPAAV